MTKIIKQRQKGFTTIDNKVIRDDKLSWKARGIFTYLWSQSDDWNFYEVEVMKHSPDGRSALRAGLKELEEHGYLKRTRKRNSAGQVTDTDWQLSEKPMFDYPTLEKPTLDYPTLENRTLRNTNLKNKQLEEITTKRKEHSPAKAEPRVTLADYQNIVGNLNKCAGTNYRATGKKTQRLIHARFADGFTAADFKTVIDNKVAEWKGTEMAKYLRPETLFGTKFESYLNQKAPQEQGEIWYE
jgi:uncharacterized phage protein (TIGR02220 family)